MMVYMKHGQEKHHAVFLQQVSVRDKLTPKRLRHKPLNKHRCDHNTLSWGSVLIGIAFNPDNGHVSDKSTNKRRLRHKPLNKHRY